MRTRRCRRCRNLPQMVACSIRWARISTQTTLLPRRGCGGAKAVLFGTLSSDDDEEGGEAGSGVIAPREPGYIDGLFDDSEEDESAVPKKEACKPNKEERKVEAHRATHEQLEQQFKELRSLGAVYLFIIIIYYSWNGGRAEAACAGGKGVRMR
jgi:hypothetical protein